MQEYLTRHCAGNGMLMNVLATRKVLLEKKSIVAHRETRWSFRTLLPLRSFSALANDVLSNPSGSTISLCPQRSLLSYRIELWQVLRSHGLPKLDPVLLSIHHYQKRLRIANLSPLG
jgi:hypothetical protein